jgi:MFS family permease
VQIGNARLFGLERDLGMAGLNYNVAVTMFFITYTLCELPFNLLVKRFGPGWFLPLSTIACVHRFPNLARLISRSSFGIVSLCHAFVTSYGGLLGARLVLGACECPSCCSGCDGLLTRLSGALLPGSAYALTRWCAATCSRLPAECALTDGAGTLDERLA